MQNYHVSVLSLYASRMTIFCFCFLIFFSPNNLSSEQGSLKSALYRSVHSNSLSVKLGPVAVGDLLQTPRSMTS